MKHKVGQTDFFYCKTFQSLKYVNDKSSAQETQKDNTHNTCFTHLFICRILFSGKCIIVPWNTGIKTKFFHLVYGVSPLLWSQVSISKPVLFPMIFFSVLATKKLPIPQRDNLIKLKFSMNLTLFFWLNTILIFQTWIKCLPSVTSLLLLHAYPAFYLYYRICGTVPLLFGSFTKLSLPPEKQFSYLFRLKAKCYLKGKDS